MIKLKKMNITEYDIQIETNSLKLKQYLGKIEEDLALTFQLMTSESYDKKKVNNLLKYRRILSSVKTKIQTRLSELKDIKRKEAEDEQKNFDKILIKTIKSEYPEVWNECIDIAKEQYDKL